MERSYQIRFPQICGRSCKPPVIFLRKSYEFLAAAPCRGRRTVKVIRLSALAARIVRHFKADTFRVMEEEPERLSEVKGISEKMAMAIAQQTMLTMAV